MGDVTLSVHVTAKLKENLQQEANLAQTSESEIAEKAIEAYLDRQAYKREMIAAAVAEADKGIFISGEAMHRWIESWGTENELPAPEPDIFPDSKP